MKVVRMGMSLIFLLSNPLIAALASASESISTKPNPLLCPDNLSVITFADETDPNAANSSFNTSSVVLKLRFDTYMFIKINLNKEIKTCDKEPQQGVC